MRRTITTLGLALAITLSQTVILPAQQAQPPSNQTTLDSIPPGDEIIVKGKDGKDRRGRVSAVTDATLTFTRDGKETLIRMTDVAEIYWVRRKEQKAKYALIGAGAGAAVGAIVGKAKNSPPVDDGEIYTQLGVTVGVGVGALIGTMIGAGRRKRTLVYRAP